MELNSINKFIKIASVKNYTLKKVGRHVGRNPFTKKKYYNGWIFELNYEKFPDCLIR